MNVLGIEIKGSDCICVLISGSGDHFTFRDFPKKVSLTDSYDTSEVKAFYEKLKSLFSDHSVDAVAVKKRTEKGKFAGGALSFKMEGIIQLASASKVSFYSGSQINAMLKKNQPDAEELNKYQQQAFYTAVNCISGN